MSLHDHSLAPRQPVKLPSLAEVVESASEEEAIRLYTLLQARLHAQLDVANLNMTEALGVLYQQAQRFVDEILYDNTIPANQRAQALNSARASLEKIVDMRTAVFSQERQKKYELAFVRAVQAVGEDAKPVMEAFMELYGESLNDRGK